MAELIDGVLMPSDAVLAVVEEHAEKAIEALTSDGLTETEAIAHVLWTAATQSVKLNGHCGTTAVMHYFADEIMTDVERMNGSIKTAEDSPAAIV